MTNSTPTETIDTMSFVIKPFQFIITKKLCYYMN